LATQLQVAEGGRAVRRYAQIELAAHEAGKRVSQQIQARMGREVAAEAPPQAACPSCGQEWPVIAEDRTVASIDGPVTLTEAKAHCDRCRRSFFPSA
jgi:hypothetical protein